MESAKEAISSFLHRGGKTDTEVEETVNPAVTSETVKPHRHEETTEAVDREVHQHHYHTTVQPISHTETLPEQHTHNLVPTVEKTYEHGSAEQDKARVAADIGQFKDHSVTNDTTHSTSAAPVVVGEHVHHHVHETVQPVIHKETHQPEVVHTTIPIHETHIAPSEHHGLSTLPMRTMEEFKSMGTSLTGGKGNRHEYEGHPRPYNPDMQTKPAPADIDPPAHTGTHDPEKTGHFSDVDTATNVPGVGTTASTAASAATGPVHQSTDEHHGAGQLAGAAVAGAGIAGAGAAAHHAHEGTDRSIGTDHVQGTDVRGASVPSAGATGVSNTGTAGLPSTDSANLSSTGATSDAPATTSHAHPSTQDPDSTRDLAAPAAAGAAGAGVGAGAGYAAAHDSHEPIPSTGGVQQEYPGRKTAHGYYTTADEQPSYEKTAHGYLTGADSKHGPQDEVASSSHDTSAGAGAATGAAGAAAAESESSRHEATQEPSNLEGSKADPEVEYDGPAIDDKGVQHASRMGEDPSLVQDQKLKDGKLTGTGVDGSHSAVFGLTPDGHKYKDTKSKTTAPVRADSGTGEAEGTKEEKEIGDGKVDEPGKQGKEGVAEQMNEPRVAEPEHEGKAEYKPDDSTKPGAGVAT